MRSKIQRNSNILHNCESSASLLSKFTNYNKEILGSSTIMNAVCMHSFVWKHKAKKRHNLIFIVFTWRGKLVFHLSHAFKRGGIADGFCILDSKTNLRHGRKWWWTGFAAVVLLPWQVLCLAATLTCISQDMKKWGLSEAALHNGCKMLFLLNR